MSNDDEMNSFKNANEEIEYLGRMIGATTDIDIGRLKSIGNRLLELSGEKSENEDLILYEDLVQLIRVCHEAAVNGGWWHDLETGEPLERNKGEMLCLIHSEISEAMEGARKNSMDDHLPNRPMEEVELADVLIRVFDYAAGHGLDVAGAFVEKLAYNAVRADHKPENRAKDDGKKF